MIRPPRQTAIFLTILIVIIAGIIILKFSLSRQPASQTNISQIDQIIPGQTTLNQLQNLPDKFAARQKENVTRIFVGQDQPRSYSTIEIHSNTVSGIIINNQSLFEFPTLAGYQNKYGSPDYALYGPGQAYGYLSYVYLKNGLIIIAHQKNKQIDEIWKISPDLTFSQFQQKYPQFSTSPQSLNRF